MNATYPVEWQGKTLKLHDLSAEMKAEYAIWVEPRALMRMKRSLETKEYLNFRQEVAGGAICWNTTASMAVGAELNTPDGEIKFNRLLFCGTDSHLNDDQLREMIETKLADPTSDYSVAMDLLWEKADPKAKAGSLPSAAPADTGNSSSGSPPTPSDCHPNSPPV